MTVKMNSWDWTSMVLVVIGGLNWGLIGLFNFDVIAFLFGPLSMVIRVIYVLVGLGALYLLASALVKISALGGEAVGRESTLRKI